jgi:hypothetical protein
MNLFIKKDFKSHSGLPLKFKIECDNLSDGDIETLAWIVSERFDFREVYGVETGGTRFSKALEKYKSTNSSNILIVDDVLTTGNSMRDYLKKIDHDIPMETRVIGVVIFSRNRAVPKWIYPIFWMW